MINCLNERYGRKWNTVIKRDYQRLLIALQNIKTRETTKTNNAPKKCLLYWSTDKKIIGKIARRLNTKSRIIC
jgi:predicted acetyltransferase